MLCLQCIWKYFKKIKKLKAIDTTAKYEKNVSELANNLIIAGQTGFVLKKGKKKKKIKTW